MFTRNLLLFIFVSAVALFSGCSNEENAEVDQRAAFETYLNGRNMEYEVVGGVYRSIINSDRPGREDAAVVLVGDSVYMDYAVREFSSSGPGRIYFTNVARYIDSLAGIGLSPAYWPKEVEKIKLGTTPVIKGLEKGLAGSAEGDSVELFILSNLGYGGGGAGVIPPDSPIVWTIKINKVVK